jgi:hypothetical protein
MPSVFAGINALIMFGTRYRRHAGDRLRSGALVAEPMVGSLIWAIESLEKIERSHCKLPLGSTLRVRSQTLQVTASGPRAAVAPLRLMSGSLFPRTAPRAL